MKTLDKTAETRGISLPRWMWQRFGEMLEHRPNSSRSALMLDFLMRLPEFKMDQEPPGRGSDGWPIVGPNKKQAESK